MLEQEKRELGGFRTVRGWDCMMKAFTHGEYIPLFVSIFNKANRAH